MSLLILAPFVGPAIGPIAGGFLGETVGWRWMQGFLGIFAGAMCLLGGLGQPETYAPVLLRNRAHRLSHISGRVYKSKLEVDNGHVDVRKKFATALGRPWLLLVIEMIVLLLSIWIGVIYGTLYMFFSAFPIVFRYGRRWSEGLVGLAFLGVAIGMCTGVAYAVPENIRYNKLMTKAKRKPVLPEQRLIPAMVAAPFVPIGVSFLLPKIIYR
jgi:MFS family permease